MVDKVGRGIRPKNASPNSYSVTGSQRLFYPIKGTNFQYQVLVELWDSLDIPEQELAQCTHKLMD